MTGDAVFDKVVLLLHFDGANGSTTFTDNSPTPKTVTALSSAAISTAQSKFGGASLGLTGGFLSVENSAGLDTSTGDFTIETWVLPASLGASAILFNKAIATEAGYPYQAYVTTSGGLVFRSYNAAVVGLFTIATAGGLVAVGAWTHLAFVRFGSTFTVYVNGVASGSASYSGALPVNAFPMSIGAYSTGSSPLYGHIDEFRFTKGVARYTANFTPPTEAFPDDARLPYSLSGTVTGSTGSPAARAIRALREDTGAYVGGVISNASTGAYTITTEHPGEHTVVVYPVTGENLPALVHHGVIPI